jgi:hypothetical protein
MGLVGIRGGEGWAWSRAGLFAKPDTLLHPQNRTRAQRFYVYPHGPAAYRFWMTMILIAIR